MKFFLMSLMLFFSTSTFAQKSAYQGLPSLIWPKLYDISFTKATDASGEYEKPIFSDAAKSLKGKKITVPGYMIPFENGIRGKHFMLSSLPVNACFFCGVGGPETVIEVYLKNEATYSENPIQVQGILVLNDDNPDKMFYILENAEILGDFDF